MSGSYWPFCLLAFFKIMSKLFGCFLSFPPQKLKFSLTTLMHLLSVWRRLVGNLPFRIINLKENEYVVYSFFYFFFSQKYLAFWLLLLLFFKVSRIKTMTVQYRVKLVARNMFAVCNMSLWFAEGGTSSWAVPMKRCQITPFGTF